MLKYGASEPWAEPYWYQGFKSPYYKETHHRFRERVRAFVEKEIAPFIDQWEEAGDYPPELRQKAYAAGVYATIYPPEYGGTPPDESGKFDIFHDLVLTDELSRCGSGGVLFACFFSFAIALPPILAVGSQYLKDLVARDVITGKKIMALAITEPWGGSDVAAVRTTAVRRGDYYVLSGEKKFITSGNKADWFTVAARTSSGTGAAGLSLFLVDAHSPGITVRRLKTQGWWASGTTYIVFDEVKVPANHLIGKENEGFAYVMKNFNHERFIGVVMATRLARVCLEESIRYARLRETFGVKLISHQVIRHKIVEMARRIESSHALIEQVAYQIASGVDDRHLGGHIALLKVHAGQCVEFCAREASQIFGGNSCLRTGPGAKVERISREVRTMLVGGGSEEIMRDLAARQARL